MMWIVQAPTGEIRGTYNSQKLAIDAAEKFMYQEQDGPFMVYVCSMVLCVDIKREVVAH